MDKDSHEPHCNYIYTVSMVAYATVQRNWVNSKHLPYRADMAAVAMTLDSTE